MTYIVYIVSSERPFRVAFVYHTVEVIPVPQIKLLFIFGKQKHFSLWFAGGKKDGVVIVENKRQRILIFIQIKTSWEIGDLV